MQMLKRKNPISIIIFKKDCSKINGANNIFAKSENTQTEDLIYTDLYIDYKFH